jgi:hypothetical protein
MHRRSALVIGAIAATCLGTALAVPSSAHLVAAQPLGNVTTITASSSGTAELVLYDDATMSPRETHNPDVSITGKGRVVAFELTRSDGTEDGLAAMRVPAFAGGVTYVGGSTIPKVNCTPGNGLLDNGSCGPYYPPTAIKLHEGYYHLAVLTDGAPVRITIRLHGQERAKGAVRLQRSFRTVEANMPEQESIGQTTVTYGVETPYADANHVGAVVEARLHPSATVLAASVCMRDDASAPPPYAFSPACPGGQNRGIGYSIAGGVRTEQGAVGGLSIQDIAGQTTHPTGVGGSFVDSDGPTYLGGVAVWVWGDDLQMFNNTFLPMPPVR